MEENNYKLMVSMLGTMKSSLETLKDTISNQLRTDFKLNDEIIDASLPYMIEDIPNMGETELRNIFTKYSLTTEPNTDSLEDLRKNFKTIKNMSLLLLSAQKEYVDIKNQSTEVMDEYLNYMSSQKVEDAREERLSRMKTILESEEDETQKKRIQKIIDTTESSKSFDFVTARLKKYGEKEIENIMDGYFNHKKGSHIITKYTSKIKQFGYNPEIYTFFFNIEENFLPEEYADFNNLFLFIYMRMVAYSDPYKNEDKLFIRALTGKIAELFYHKMSKEDEEKFINVVKRVDNFFMDKKEYFSKNNTTSPNHPIRKEQNERVDSAKIQGIKKKLQDLQYPGVYPEDATADQLQKIFEKYVTELIEKQVAKKEENLEGEEITEKRIQTGIDTINDSIEKINSTEE